MNTFTESKALSILSSQGADIKDKLIISKGGFRGLTACAALDFLTLHCGYRANLLV